MAKMGGFPGMGGMNINKILKQAQQMQKDIKKSQEEIANKTFTSTVGGGVLTGTMSGERKMLSLEVKEELIKSQDKEMIEDLVILCVNDLLSKIDEEEKQITDGMNIPGLGL